MRPVDELGLQRLPPSKRHLNALQSQAHKSEFLWLVDGRTLIHNINFHLQVIRSLDSEVNQSAAFSSNNVDNTR
jgi:hypothetical protein